MLTHGRTFVSIDMSARHAYLLLTIQTRPAQSFLDCPIPKPPGSSPATRRDSCEEVESWPYMRYNPQRAVMREMFERSSIGLGEHLHGL